MAAEEFDDAALKELRRTMGKMHGNNALFVGEIGAGRTAVLQRLVEKMNKASEANPPAVLEISGDKASLETFLASPPGTKAFVSRDMSEIVADPETRDLVKQALQHGGLIGFTIVNREILARDPAIIRRMDSINLTTRSGPS